jgi:putative oxidoreductase
MTVATHRRDDTLLLVGRLMVALLFLIFGWEKAIEPSQTVAMFTTMGVPAPTASAAVAILMEVGGGLLLAIGVAWRPLCAAMILYTLGTAVVGHHFWNMAGEARFLAEIGFFKNVAISGGLLAFYVTGPGNLAPKARGARP